jgi:hypothetical protein
MECDDFNHNEMVASGGRDLETLLNKFIDLLVPVRVRN